MKNLIKKGLLVLAPAILFSISDKKANNLLNLEQSIEQEHSKIKVGTPSKKIDLPQDQFFEELYKNRAKIILENDSARLNCQTRLSRISRFEDIINNGKYDPDFMTALLAIESNGKPRAKSKTGPKGLPQFARITAKQHKLKVNWVIDERYNPEKAIPASERHLDLIISRYGGIKEFSVGNVLLSKDYGDITMEKILYSYHNWKKIELKGKKLYDSLSPRLQWYIQEIGGIMCLLKNNKIKYEKSSLYTEELKNTYTRKVRFGESLASISRKEKKPLKHIKSVNLEIREWDKIRPGQKINIPN